MKGKTSKIFCLLLKNTLDNDDNYSILMIHGTEQLPKYSSPRL